MSPKDTCVKSSGYDHFPNGHSSRGLVNHSLLASAYDSHADALWARHKIFLVGGRLRDVPKERLRKKYKMLPENLAKKKSILMRFLTESHDFKKRE